MTTTIRRPLAIAGGIGAGLMLATTAPAAAVTIPDPVVEAGSTSVIHFRVESCEGSATDSLVVSIPESVTDVMPEALPGWTVETYTVADIGAGEAPPSPAASPDAPLAGPGDPVRTVRWSGGSLPLGQYQEFGIWASFPEEADGPLTFPAVQVCGDTRVVWDGDADADLPAPRVRIGEVIGPREVADIAESVADLTQDVEALAQSIGDANLENLRTRVRQLEAADVQLQGREEAITERLNRLRDRIVALEEALGEEPADDNDGDAGNAADGETDEPAAEG